MTGAKGSVSQSFTLAQLDALDELLATVRRGGDASLILRSPAMVEVMAKVARMSEASARIRADRGDAS